jgi:hypothetical protein
VNTPETIMSQTQGKEWDAVQRKWVRYDLEEEAARVLHDEEKDRES